MKLPEGEDENEWLAVNSKMSKQPFRWISTDLALVVDFYNHINLLYGSITEFCSPQSCPEMKATDECVALNLITSAVLIKARFEYLWQDSDNFKRPTKMPAPTYIEHLMGWVQSSIDNEVVFPSRVGGLNLLQLLYLVFC